MVHTTSYRVRIYLVANRPEYEVLWYERTSGVRIYLVANRPGYEAIGYEIVLSVPRQTNSVLSLHSIGGAFKDTSKSVCAFEDISKSAMCI